MTVGRRLLPLVLGHRGAPRVAPENTLAAMEAAIALGADGVEFDVRLTADGALVLHHDAETASGLVIREVDSESLPSWIPLLDDVLDALEHCAMVNVEIKDHPAEVGLAAADATARAVAEILSNRSHTDHLVVSSFSTEALVTLREVSPRLAVGVLTPTGSAAAGIDQAIRLGAVAVHPAEADVTAELVGRAHDEGLKVSTWTVNDRDRAVELVGWGADAIITDVPDEIGPVVRSGPGREE